jgi:hypothetical protein
MQRQWFCGHFCNTPVLLICALALYLVLETLESVLVAQAICPHDGRKPTHL